MKLSSLIAQYQGTANTSFEDEEVFAVRPLDEAQKGDISFFSNPKYKGLLETTQASAVLVKAFLPAPCLQIQVDDPYRVMADLLAVFHPEPQVQPGIHPTAIIGDACQIDATASIGPFCVLGSGVQIGAHCQLMAHTVIGENSQIGAYSKLFPHVSVYANSQIGDRVRIHANSVIGSDGYGYVFSAGKHQKIPQVGIVIIEDDVEIGSNVSIDRGALKPTRIGRGSKIDNLVQIAHGVQIGQHALIISQSGIAGSSKVGNYSILAGQVGVNGHVEIGDQITIMGKSVVTKNLDQAGKYAGNPAVPHMQYQRQLASLRSLDKIKGRLAELEKKCSNCGENDD
ncbi:MAG: UDP-3-O-(3-hydroxymyristoyl)glucosamine N-acyltransferase [Acidobacteria bacterium]|nr:UDP-3-O-(3-hydroxymyristoyl)glucosamine N-acyltransferase [Acidobacteriota bacterium]MCB9398130.1 UDP-3-O-(3-hydroxymyristoyl)glucosamine N-acyltransferase [Acidobacteriota bacterium]